MAKDLRTFLAYLEEHHPNELYRIERPVDVNWEVAAVLRRFRKEREKYGYPAVLFENVKGFDFPLVTNVLGARSRLGAMFETTPQNALNEYMKREHDFIPPVMVETGPVRENIITGEDVDVSKFPVPWHAEKDGGPYITGSLAILKNPVTGVHNVGCYRIQPKGPRKLAISLGPHSHAFRILRENEKQGKDTEIVIALGHHPAAVAGSTSRVPDYVSELDAIGGLLGEPLEMVPGQTVNLPVPARTEIVFEGRLVCNERETEGPLGEYTWYYGPVRKKPVVEVTAITYRNNPIYYDLNNAYHEHSYTAVLAIESQIFQQIRNVIPTVKRVRMPDSGCSRFLVFVQIEKIMQGEGVNAALAALAAESYLKMAVVVDEDVDIDDDEEVWWAVMTRSAASKNWFFVPNAQVNRLLPISHDELTAHAPGQIEHLAGLDTKVGIDATKPLSYEFLERQDVRRSDWENLNLESYIRWARGSVARVEGD